MKDEVFAKFMRQFMDAEATPILGTVEGIDMEKYKDSLEERFANPNIKDSVSRICSENSAKLPKFLIPTILENLERNGSIQYATFILAAWCYYSDKEMNERNEVLQILDEKKDQLHQAAKQTQNDWEVFLYQSEIFGDLVENEKFKNEYVKAVQSIYRDKDIRKLMSGINVNR